MYNKVAKLNQSISNIDLSPWIEGFMRVHGIKQAKIFLKDVGIVNPANT
jgi:hypothetical protein